MCSYIEGIRWLYEVLDALWLMSGSLFVLGPIFLYALVGRPFDRRYKHDQREKIGSDFWFGWFSTLFLRPISYAVMIAFLTSNNFERIKKSGFAEHQAFIHDYNGENPSSEASRTQKILSYLYIGNLIFLFILIIPIFHICSFNEIAN